jgi:hypothetical protein
LRDGRSRKPVLSVLSRHASMMAKLDHRRKRRNDR